MADTSIGTARVDVVVNTDQFDAAIKSAKRSVSDMSQAAQDQYNKLSAAEKRRVDSLINQANKIGLTRDQQVAYNAALKTQGPILDEITRKLAKNATATNAVATGLGNSGKTAKELQFAMRGLPAQLTDIGVGLASGQRPMMVLLQQGGQLKDMFGGIRPAAAALGQSLLAMINPLTLTAAAAGALLIAWKKGSDEATAFSKALILTGNQANTTAKELAALAEEMDNIGGVTEHSAAAALAQVVASGEFTEAQFKQVATAAELMRTATGKSIQETIQEFAKIKGDPVKALLEFNEKQRFLTQAQLDNIRTLKEQGREAAAVAEAFRIYYDVQVDRAGEVVAHLGTVERAWRGIQLGISEATSKLMDFGREGTRASVALERALRAMPFGVGSTIGWALGKGGEGAKTGTGGNAAALDSEQARAALKALEDQDKAQRKFFEDGLGYGSKREQLEQRILQMIADGQEAGISGDKLRLRAAQMRAEAEEKASGGKSGGKKKALPDFAKDAKKELEKLLETESRARDQFNAMAATLDGPLAAAQYRYQEDQAKLNELAKAGAIDTDALAQAQANLTQQFDADRKAIEAQLHPAAQLIDNLREELRLRQLTNAEAQTAIDLAHLAVPATQAEAAEILALNQQLEDQAKATQQMDEFRRSASDALSGLIDGSKSAKEAIGDFFDELTRRAAQAVSDQLIAALFGQQGQSGGGAWGNMLASLFGGAAGGSWSGGTYTYAGDFGFANGGYTGDGPRNQPAGVVHKGEYVMNAATVRALGRGHLDQIAAGRSPASNTWTTQGQRPIQQVINVTGTVTNSTANQIRLQTGREIREALARF